jgi:hypothetical protein
MTDERAIRMALELAALAVAIREYTDTPGHQTGNCGPCVLCRAIALFDRKPLSGRVSGEQMCDNKDDDPGSAGNTHRGLAATPQLSKPGGDGL